MPVGLTSLFPASADLLPGAGTGRAWPPLQELTRACLRGHGLRGRLLERSCRHLPGRWLLRVLDRIAAPGLTAHFRWRKHWIGERVSQHLATDGQLLVLGSGFDTLGLQVARQMQAAQVFEFDLPAQIERKAGHAADLGLTTTNWHPHGADFGCSHGIDRWADSLSAHPAWRAEAATVIIAEGLSMYLPPSAVRRLLARLRCLFADQAVLIATVMDRRPDGRPGFESQAWWVERWLRRSGEPFRWGLHVDELRACIGASGPGESGLSGLERADPLDPNAPDPCIGEHVFLARLACARRNADAPGKGRSGAG